MSQLFYLLTLIWTHVIQDIIIGKHAPSQRNTITKEYYIQETSETNGYTFSA